MARKSTIKTLPADILEKLQELLRDPRVSQLEATAKINAILEAEGLEAVSKSAVNRYSLEMEEAGQKLRESREVAEMWIGKLGAAPQGQVGQLVNEILRTFAFDLGLAMQRGGIDPENAPAAAKMLKDMAVAMERLERAASENVKREEEIRRQEREKLKEQTLEAVDKAEAGGQKMTPDRLRAIIREAYGVAA